SPDGRAIAVTNRPLPGGSWIGTHTDITEHRRAEEHIAYLARHDVLTGLPNRSAFAAYLAATIDRAQSTNEQFAVLCLDLDCFKLGNDLHGHAAGDALLQELAGRRQITAEGAFIARFGGDEFTIVLQGAAQETAERIAAQLLKAVDEDLNVD